FSPADVGCDAEEVEWEFYVLDEPADDMQDLRTENFFPSQSKTARCYIDEEIDVTQGDYVYCRCNISADTADEMPEGKSELTLTLEPLEDTTHVMVDANYTYDNMFYSFRASQSGTYQVVNATAEGEEDVNWIIYVMDRYFDDAYRYIYSAYPAVLIGEGSFTVEEGQYVYISTDHSNYSGYDPVPEGENILTLFMEDESTDAT
ncbi:MAG: hypothetical protein LIO95_01815, partial [Clostridiales bacterium]|nr:hypothetical protein [Clostridiales bacterium]